MIIFQALEDEGHNPEEFDFESTATPKKGGTANKTADGKLCHF
jgi:hypothetical protein